MFGNSQIDIPFYLLNAYNAALQQKHFYDKLQLLQFLSQQQNLFQFHSTSPYQYISPPLNFDPKNHFFPGANSQGPESDENTRSRASLSDEKTVDNYKGKKKKI